MLTPPALGPRRILAAVWLVWLLCALAILPARADQVTDSVSDQTASQGYGQASGQVLRHASGQVYDQITSQAAGQAAAQGSIEVSDEVALPWRLVIEGAPALRSGIEASLASVLRRYEGSATGIQVERMMQQMKPLALDALAAEGYFRATVDLAVEAPTRDALASAVASGQPEDGVVDSTSAGTGTQFRPAFGVGAGPGAPIMPKLSRLLSSGPGRVVRLQVVTGERTSVGQIQIRFEGTIADEQAEAAARAAAAERKNAGASDAARRATRGGTAGRRRAGCGGRQGRRGRWGRRRRAGRRNCHASFRSSRGSEGKRGLFRRLWSGGRGVQLAGWRAAAAACACGAAARGAAPRGSAH